MNDSGHKKRSFKLIGKNRKAWHDYEILSKLEAGIVLTGTEVKSLRSGKCSLQEAYAGFKSHDDYELYLMNLHIPEYEHGNRENHNPRRQRKLLISRREALKFKSSIKEKGFTLIPLSIYFSGHLVKVEIGVARAKKKFDKREDSKKRDADREIRRKFRV